MTEVENCIKWLAQIVAKKLKCPSNLTVQDLSIAGIVIGNEALGDIKLDSWMFIYKHSLIKRWLERLFDNLFEILSFS